MKAEHLIIAGAGCAALASAYWAAQIYMSGPHQLEPIAFTEYSKIDDPLYRQKDIVYIGPPGFEGSLITGSIPQSGNPSKQDANQVSGYSVVNVYEDLAIIRDRSGKIWSLVPGSQAPEIGIVLQVEANAEFWTVTGTHGVVSTNRAKLN